MIPMLRLAACSEEGQAKQDQQEKPIQEEEKVAEMDLQEEPELEVPVLKKQEVQEILKEHLDLIIAVFIELGEQHKWQNYGNPADFNEIKPRLENYATQ